MPMPLPMPMPMPIPEAIAADDGIARAMPAAPMGTVAALGDQIDWADSPARLLHERLVESFSLPEPTADDRLPGAVRVGVIVGSSLLLWALIGAVAIFIF